MLGAKHHKHDNEGAHLIIILSFPTPPGSYERRTALVDNACRAGWVGATIYYLCELCGERHITPHSTPYSLGPSGYCFAPRYGYGQGLQLG
jgi:hypothetical protein